MRFVNQMRVFAFPLLCFCVVSCASYTDDTQEIRSLYRSGQYTSALEKLEESALKDQDRNKLLYLLEKGMITDRLGKSKASRDVLMAADRLADKLYTTSISNEALTYIYNDTAQDYAGEDYEVVATHTMLALSFIGTGDLKSARVEARKINNKLNELNDKHGDSKNRYSEDALARYIAAAIYESRGEIDSAIIDYKKALKLYEGIYSSAFATSTPDQLVGALYRLLVRRGRTTDIRKLGKSYPSLVKKIKRDAKSSKLYGEVIVFQESGMIAVKKTHEFFIPFGRQVIRLSFPKIRPKTYSSTGSSTVKVDGKSFHSELLQNMDQIASKTLDDRRTRLVLKQGARLLAKGQLTNQAHRNFGPIAGIAANVYSAATETADTRGWTLLPGAFYATRMKLKAGTHKIKISSNYGPTREKTITVKSGTLTIIRAKN